MKNEVNRALVAKKKQYINPSVQVAQFSTESTILALSNMGMYDEQSGQW